MVDSGYKGVRIFGIKELYRLLKTTLFVIPMQLFTLVGHAQESELARLEGSRVILPAVRVGSNFVRAELSLHPSESGPEFQLEDFVIISDPAVESSSEFKNGILSIPEIQVSNQLFQAELELIDQESFRFRLINAGPVPVPEATLPVSCNMEFDRTNGPDSPAIANGWAIPTGFVRDGGPAPDGIPSLEGPLFLASGSPVAIDPEQLVIGVKLGDDVRAYPHNILDWHEVVNDRFQVNGRSEDVTLSYCPLTGSAVLWDALVDSQDPTFGTSGLLYNSNLIMYDRETGSLWSQMLEQAVSGPEILAVPDKLQVVETTWQNWSSMYPQTRVLSEQTGFSRDYSRYPYGSYREDSSLLFNVNNSQDNRLHRKERVLGINVGESSKVYPVAAFSEDVEVINDSVGNQPVVVAGSAGDNFGVVYYSRLNDCTLLEFEAVQNQLPIVMEDQEGNQWDIFGEAQSGPRAGQQLRKTNSYIAFWFAWTAFFTGAEIHGR